MFLNSPEEVWTRVRYIEQYPEKEGLPMQGYALGFPENNWPFPTAISFAPRKRKRTP